VFSKRGEAENTLRLHLQTKNTFVKKLELNKLREDFLAIKFKIYFLLPKETKLHNVCYMKLIS